MSKTAIKIENLSKVYQLGEIGTGTISRDIERWWAKLKGNEDPFLRIGENNDRTTKSKSNVVWSLKDINFEIEKGDAVGIIGRNGAGKSTLLKILSKVTAPTTGKIYGNGRIASLLEVGTGFHPELTGRENIYLNGAILGMRKSEIDRKFDEIVDFSGVERYVDTPVKRYSSGMYVRLAFAVAAHLESEILIIDEVLAVGDYDFQSKCLGKMNQLKDQNGRTLIFVSHNLESISRLCKNSIWLDNGKLMQFSPTNEIIESYKSFLSNSNNSKISAISSQRIKIKSHELIFDGELIYNSSDFYVVLMCEHLINDSLKDNYILEFYREGNLSFISTSFHIKKGETKIYTLRIKVPKFLLNPGFYSINVKVVDETGNFIEYLYIKDIFTFEVVDNGFRRGDYKLGWDGPVSPLLDYEYV